MSTQAGAIRARQQPGIEARSAGFDSYASPDAEALLRKASLRWARDGLKSRVLATEAVAGALFVVCATAIALLAPTTRPLSLGALLVSAAAYLVAAQVTFPVGSAWTRPTQLAFVPMLFLLPLGIVPLVVMACQVLALWPSTRARDLSPSRVFGRLGDSFHALGPVLVLLVAGGDTFAWGRWPVLLVAFAAQVALDLASGFGRTWFAERIVPSAQVQMLWIYLTDACLSCVGLTVAASAVVHPALVLLTMPLLVLLGLFARERQQRLDGTLELSTAYRGTALLLGDVVEGDHEYTGVHSREVVDLSVAVADALGLDALARRNVEFAALLHDVGKIRVPKQIINKPGKLTDEEWAVMRRHTIEGEAMLRQVGGLLAEVGRIVRASHERFDGRGYPDGLAGETIPVEARIVCACDAYSAMTTDRPYRAALPVEEALAELHRCAGTQFDPDVVAALVGVVTPALPATV